MRFPVALVALFAVPTALAGCTVIPPADPSRMQAPPQQAEQPPYTPGPAAAPPYTPAQQYTPPPSYDPAPAPPPPGPPPPPPPEAYQPAPAPSAPLTYAAIGQAVRVDGPRVTPLQVLEDSRCPMNARCVWGGQVRLRIRVEGARGGDMEITSGKPVTVADGTLELVEVRPDKMAGGGNGGEIAPSAYRFGFRFMGGY